MSEVAELQDALHTFLEKHLGPCDSPGRVRALIRYCVGLGLEIADKTVQGIAKRLAPNSIEGCRQGMKNALLHGRFEGADVFARLQDTCWAAPERFNAYVIDDTGFAKQGNDSVGVQRQYSGTLGKVGNCQVAVSLHACSDETSCVLDARLYLPANWAEQAELRKLGKIPKKIEFRTKPEIALLLLETAIARGGPCMPVLADAGYGDDRKFRDGITALGLEYAVGISGQTTVWRPGVILAVPELSGRRGPKSTRLSDQNGSEPVLVSSLASELWARGEFQEIEWRAGSRGPLAGTFAAVRIRSAEGRTKGHAPSDEQWLLMEQVGLKKREFKYTLISCAAATTLIDLVALTKQRWRIEYDYREMKQHLGLDSYEGRSWGGFHRHFAMVALMHAFVSLQKEAFSPEAATKSSTHDENSADEEAAQRDSKKKAKYVQPNCQFPAPHLRALQSATTGPSSCVH